jgi:hypothetical protein
MLARLLAQMNANQASSDANLREMRAGHEEMAYMRAWGNQMKVRRKDKMDACLEKTETCVRPLKVTDLEANPEATQAVMEKQEVRNEEMIVDAIGALEDRYRDRHLAVRRRQEPKKRT